MAYNKNPIRYKFSSVLATEFQLFIVLKRKFTFGEILI